MTRVSTRPLIQIVKDRRFWESLCGGILVVVGVTLSVEAARLPLSPLYAQIGPRLFPILVGAGMSLVGLGFLAEIILTERRKKPAVPKLDYWPIVLIVCAVILYTFILERLGYIASTALFFVIITFAFTDKHWARNSAIGLLLALAIFFVFTQALDLVLPRGVWFAG